MALYMGNWGHNPTSIGVITSVITGRGPPCMEVAFFGTFFLQKHLEVWTTPWKSDMTMDKTYHLKMHLLLNGDFSFTC